jgi:hypothetical protein
LTRDIGAGGVAGGASFTNGVFTLTGAGTDIWGPADVFRFGYVTTTGDCTIVARVTSVQDINAWAKAGIMIRENLTDSGEYAFIAVTPGNGVTWQYRQLPGWSCINSNAPTLAAPYWVKLVRSGNTFTGYHSPNGTSWTQLGAATFTMSSNAYVGLALSSRYNSTLGTATFDNVIAPGSTPSGLTATAGSGQAALSWLTFSNATSYNVKRSTISGGPYATIATGVTTTNYTDTGVSAGVRYYYVVSAMVGGTETPDSPEAALRFPKLTGSIIGTPGSWGGYGDTIAKVFDNDLNTFFDAPDGNGAWAGLDFGAGVSNVITQINYCPRSGFESRMVGGVFQGANQANFSDAVTLATVTTSPAAGGFTSVTITNAAAFRYVRYLAPDSSWGNVAEVEFYGFAFRLESSPQMSLALVGTNLTLSWPLDSTGFTLQSRTNLTLGNWLDVTSPPPQVVSSQWQVALPLTDNVCSAFYRLSK